MELLFFFCSGKLPSSAAATPSREATSNRKDSLQPTITAALNLVSTAASGQPSATSATSGSTSAPSPASTSGSTTSPVPVAVKKQRPLLPKETAQAVQRAVVWNPTKFQTSSQKWHKQKVQRQQQEEQSAAQPPAQSPGQTHSPQQLQSQQQNSSSSTRYQTRQAAKGIYTSLIIHLDIKLCIFKMKMCIKRCIISIFPHLYPLQCKKTCLRVLPHPQLPRSHLAAPLLSCQETCRSLQAQQRWLQI